MPRLSRFGIASGVGLDQRNRDSPEGDSVFIHGCQRTEGFAGRRTVWSESSDHMAVNWHFLIVLRASRNATVTTAQKSTKKSRKVIPKVTTSVTFRINWHNFFGIIWHISPGQKELYLGEPKRSVHTCDKYRRKNSAS
jgi:hypothetical protein